MSISLYFDSSFIYSYLALDPHKSICCYQDAYDVIQGDDTERFLGTVYDALDHELSLISYSVIFGMNVGLIFSSFY